MRRLLATLRARLVRRDEGGTATVFVVGFAVVLLACAGLVIDGGSAINARMKLADAEGRAAAQSQSMLVAQLLLCVGFLLFLTYPAVARVLGG